MQNSTRSDRSVTALTIQEIVTDRPTERPGNRRIMWVHPEVKHSSICLSLFYSSCFYAILISARRGGQPKEFNLTMKYPRWNSTIDFDLDNNFHLIDKNVLDLLSIRLYYKLLNQVHYYANIFALPWREIFSKTSFEGVFFL